MWDALLIGGAVRAHVWSGLFISLHDGVPPLFPWLLALVQQFPLDPILAARILSVLAGGGTIVALFALGRAWASWRAGVIAAILYIACPFALFTDRIGLLDGMLALWSLLAAALTWQACGHMTRRPVVWGVGAGLCLGAALLTKSIAVLGLAFPVLALALPETRGALWGARGAAVRSPAIILRRQRIAAEIIYVVAALVWSVLLFSGQIANILYPFRLQAGVAQTGGVFTRLPATLAAVVDDALRYLTPPLAVALVIAVGWTLLRATGPARYLAWWVIIAGGALVLTAGSFFPPRYLAPLLPPTLLCGAITMESLLVRLGSRRGGIVLLVVGVLSLIWAVPFDRALLVDPTQAALPAVDRDQYITGWPAGYGLPEALTVARLLGGQGFTLDVLSATNPPFTQAQITYRNVPGALIAPVSLDTALPCLPPATMALLDTPRDDEKVFRRANPGWRRVAAFNRPDHGGAYVLYACTQPGLAGIHQGDGT